MDPERVRRAHGIFTAALGTPRGIRDAAVSAACGDDAALEANVRRLLAASDRKSDFLESPALAGRPGVSERPLDAVGSYLVVGVLGVGGMATVYEAVQENPSRRVALKVMHQGMTHTDAFLRFRLEAETLARLHHPGIGQIYEAGAAAIGQPSPSPFFAMELVPNAMTITAYAQHKGLSLHDRLQMFASICDAVVHGHQNGIIHRDLKPRNILVGLDGKAKVIDFGIARTIDAGAMDAPPITREADGRKLINTLVSMSPEQCTRPTEVDVRTDVYSLGVVLYELVTDRLPHDLSQCSISEAVRIITQESPPPASAACPEAKGDLDAIVARAMDKDRTRRYIGASDLAADVRRWLAFQPIETRPSQ